LDVQSEVGQALVKAVDQALARWDEAMEDDFNTGGAIGHLFELVREYNRLLDQDEPALAADRQALEYTRDKLDLMAGVLGFFREGLPRERERTAPEEVLGLLERRNQARREKNWAEADRLRDLIQAAGFQIMDGPEGSRLKRG